ncbi:MAG TPA: inosine/xanthosine triphosphatase [Myxococcota bacterium]|nr:inosine/xanthosine triphosphatase [Myxococcota bacterium]
MVRVGSRNAAKLEAVRRGLAPFFAGVDVLGGEAPSGVDAQPLGFAEIVAGARNRARVSHSSGGCDLAAGIEDGLIELPEVPTGWVNVGCCVLFDGAREGFGFSAGFEYPPDCVAAATRSPRTPIGDAFERRFAPRAGTRDPGAGAGNIGRLSEGALTRADYGAQAVTCAWLRFMHGDLYAGVPA